MILKIAKFHNFPRPTPWQLINFFQKNSQGDPPLKILKNLIFSRKISSEMKFSRFFSSEMKFVQFFQNFIQHEILRKTKNQKKFYFFSHQRKWISHDKEKTKNKFFSSKTTNHSLN